MSYIDLHLHLLPGVDDGPGSEADAVAHAAKLAAAGVHEATVTPHVGHAAFPLDVSTIADRTRALQATLEKAGIALALPPGGEIRPAGAVDPHRRDLQRIAHGPRGSRWVLLEVPFGGISRRFA